MARLAALAPTLVALEATGGLELPLVAELLQAQFPVAVVNLRQVRDFAKALGKLAKTDTLDARVLAQFGEATKPQPRPLPDTQTQELKALVSRRRQWWRCSLPRKTASTERFLACIPNLRSWTKTLRGAGTGHPPAWLAKEQLLKGVPGVGPVLSIVLVGWHLQPRQWHPERPPHRVGVDVVRCGPPSTWRLWSPLGSIR